MEKLTKEEVLSQVVVIKSNDDLTDFNDVKLEGSVNKAIVASGVRDVPMEVAKEVLGDVIKEVQDTVPVEKRTSGFPPSVETKNIRKWVADSLAKRNLGEIKEAYTDYKA